MTQPVTICLPVPAGDDALAIAEVLVNERLAGAVNAIAGATSIFRWRGEVHREHETLLLISTVSDRVTEVVARVKTLHSYVVPGARAWPIVDGNPDWLAWVVEQTR